jgi:SAM-dependent methyltransferase
MRIPPAPKEFVDAYGMELMAIHRGDEEYEIIERDDGYIDIADALGTYFASYADWPEIEQEAFGFVRGRVLDIGAGAGRHSLYLQQCGCQVTAIDNSPLAVQVCKERGLSDARVIAIEDIALLQPETFDTILMLGNNFGLFGTPRKARRLLKVMRKITNAGAVIIGQTMDPLRTSNPCHLAYHERNRARDRQAGEVRIRVRFRDVIGPWIHYLFVSEQELVRILEGTGWGIERIIRDETPQYVAVLRKQ